MSARQVGAYVLLALTALAASIALVLGTTAGCASLSNRNNRLFAERAKYQATTAFYRLCVRKASVGVITPECRPR